MTSTGTFVKPAVYNNIHRVLHNNLCHFSSRLIENLVKVILRQHAVSWIRCIWVVEDLKSGVS